MRFMIIDDDMYMADVISAFLKKKSYEVVVHSTVSDGLRHIMENEFDGIILDLHMPGMGAMEAVPIIKEIKPDLCVGIVTSDTSASAKYSALKAGADFFLEKPKDIPNILNAIETYRHKKAS